MIQKILSCFLVTTIYNIKREREGEREREREGERGREREKEDIMLGQSKDNAPPGNRVGL